jgi:hypothetical protein
MAENCARSPSVPFTIPPDSPLATGWRATLAELLLRHDVQDVLDAVAAFAELRCRQEPDTDKGWRDAADPAVRRIETQAEQQGNQKPALPTLGARCRRILHAMQQIGAVSADCRARHRDIVCFIDPDANLSTWHVNFATLHQMGLIESVKGKDGGVWLTQCAARLSAI